MAPDRMDSIRILQDLIGFPTVSRDSNLDLINYVAEILEGCGVQPRLVRSADGRKANLFATIGPLDRPGVMLSGHSDVVPVDGQDWTVPPFTMTVKDGRLFGRGTADMKGFVACALAASVKASGMSLATPLHLAISYDEEIGCVGVRGLIETLRSAPFQPLLCLVGEPTNMQVAIGHKGKIAARAICRGREGHSALAPLALNAIHMGCDFVEALREEQARFAQSGSQDEDYEVPYTTIHAGTFTSGTALNIVPNLCEIGFEIRNIEADDPEVILERLRRAGNRIAEAASTVAPDSAVEIELLNSYPGLQTPADSSAVAFVKELTGAAETMKVAFGTEAGLFSRGLGIPAVVCGPGSMAQGHKADEYVTVEQIDGCDRMLDRLLARLADPAPIV